MGGDSDRSEYWWTQRHISGTMVELPIVRGVASRKDDGKDE